MNEKEIFFEALQRPDESERAAYLDDACGGNPELRQGVEALLHEHARLGSFIESPATALLDVAKAQTPPEQADSGPTGSIENGILGDYRILREIGRGGMGVVYEGEQISLSRKVALKVLPFAAMLDPRQLQRFQNEARAAASLRHPNVVQVHYVGCERAIHFYAMDYIEGYTLADLISQLRQSHRLDTEITEDSGRVTLDMAGNLALGELPAPKASSIQGVPPKEHAKQQSPPATAASGQAGISTVRSTTSREFFRSIAELGRQVAEALDHAHEHGIIHRDVKPSNVIIDNAGTPWITDFGLARIENDATLTVSGDLLGTVRYMSPEQALAKRIVVDHRTDIYSLGVTLYELSTLHPPFDGKDRQELLRQIAFDEPKRPRRLNKAIPAELEIIITKAMAKNPLERYDTAQELADDLQRYLEDRPILARRPTLRQWAVQWSRRHKSVVRAAAILLVVATLGFALSTYLIAMEQGRTQQALAEAQEAERAEARQKALAEARRLEADKERVRAEQNYRTAREAVDRLFTGVAERLKDQPHMGEIRRELLEDALEFYLGFVKQRSDNPELQFETALAHRRAGEIQGLLGQWEKSLGNHQASAKILTELKKLAPLNVAYHAHLARSYDHLANASIKLKRFTDAESHLEAGIALGETLVQNNPKVPKYRVDLMKLFRTGASGAARQYNFKERNQYRVRADKLLHQLREGFPNYPVEPQLRDESTAHKKLGKEIKTLRDIEQKKRADITSLEAQVQAHPKIPQYRKRLSADLMDLYGILLAMDQFEELESLCIKAIALNEKLSVDYPEVLEYQIGLEWSQYTYAMFLHFMGRESEGVEFFRLAIETASKVLEKAPDNKRHYWHLAGMLNNCPAHQFRDPERAVQLATRVVQFDGGAGEWSELARAQLHAKQYEEALHSCRKVKEAGGEYTQLAAIYESVATWHLGDKQNAKRQFQHATRAIEEAQRSSWRHLLEYRLARRECEEMMGIAPDQTDAAFQQDQRGEIEPKHDE